MPDTCHDGKMPLKDVARIQKNIVGVCEAFADMPHLEFAKWAISEVAALSRTNMRLARLASIGADVMFHIRAGGSVILTEPPATEMEQ